MFLALRGQALNLTSPPNQQQPELQHVGIGGIVQEHRARLTSPFHGKPIFHASHEFTTARNPLGDSGREFISLQFQDALREAAMNECGVEIVQDR